MRSHSGAARAILSGLLLVAWVVLLGASALPCRPCPCCHERDACPPAPAGELAYVPCSCGPSAPAQAPADQLSAPAAATASADAQAAHPALIRVPAEAGDHVAAVIPVPASPPRDLSTTVLVI